MSTKAENAQLPARVEWVEETEYMELPADPEWNLYSDTARVWTGEVDAQKERQDAFGTADSKGQFRGPQDSSLSVEYDLQNWFVDNNGNLTDAAAYAALRTAQNQIHGTHTVVKRKEMHAGQGAAGAGRRVYSVWRGSVPIQVVINLDPSSGLPIGIELEYEAAQARMYTIDQPDGETTLTVSSTDNGDDTQTLTIEDEDAGTTEDVSLDGTADVTTTASFGDIDALELDAETAGNVTVEDGSGNTLATLYGGLEYSNDDNPVDGDLGVPALGTGSHASEIGTGYEHFVGDTVERPAGSAFQFADSDDDLSIHVATITIENAEDKNARHTSFSQAIDVENRTIEMDVDVGGANVTHDAIRSYLRGVEDDIIWEPEDGKSMTLEGAECTDVGDDEEETGQARAVLSNTFEAQGVDMEG